MRLEGRDQTIIVTARGAVRELARELGFGVVDQTRLATAVSEIARNAVQYAGKGLVEFRVLEGERVGLEVVVSDEGPGIPDIPRVLAGGYSTVQGFGRGISGARALVDEFTLESIPGKGTRVRMRKWLP
ncbi:MAG: anti-sigma regulatory factor [Firmicutes bacterium]|nr:anti-sigma regulatory factor [Bacillota bacterium]